jgi:hypothetical protein
VVPPFLFSLLVGNVLVSHFYVAELIDGFESVGSHRLLCSANFAERFGPLADHDIPVHVLLFLPANGTRPAKCAQLTMFFDGNGGLPALLSSGVPGDFINLVQVYLAVFSSILLDLAPDADHAAIVTRVFTNNDPIRARFSKLSLKLVTTLDGPLQRSFFAAVGAIADEFGLGDILQSDPDIPTNSLSLWAINATDALMTTLRHKLYNNLSYKLNLRWDTENL